MKWWEWTVLAMVCALIVAPLAFAALTQQQSDDPGKQWKTLGHTLHIGASYADAEWRIRHLRCAATPPDDDCEKE